MKKILWVYAAMLVMASLITSCHISDGELGEDLLPPADSVNLFHDTIFEIHAYPVTGKPLITSETSFDYNKLMLLGNVQDTIVGSSVASMITQFNTTSSFKNGPNMEIDTLMFSMYMTDYMGDMNQEITFRVYEFNERIFSDSIYYSNYNTEGTFGPNPLVVKSVVPENSTTIDFLIQDQDFIDKFLAIETDTIYFRNDSIFKDYFNGLYITAESASPDGTMTRVHLANPLSRISLKYANDSTEIDSTAGRDYVWTYFKINEFSSQKINLFEHDYTGTHLSEIINNENVSSPYLYVQGMAGVNTRFSFANLADWIDKAPMAVSSASLVFEVVPEEESGIFYDNLPNRLMIGTILEEETFERIYDYVVLLNSQQGTRFGGYKKAESKGMFHDTTFNYTFNVSLHFQHMVDGEKPDNDFILQLDDGKVNPKISKLWSNLPANNKRIRLEIVYLKL